MEFKIVAKIKKAKTPNKSNGDLKTQFITQVTNIRSKFNNSLKHLKISHKKAKKPTKIELKARRDQQKRGILGIGLLFVFVSIAYSTYMTNLFVDGTQMVIALAPQVIFTLVIFIIAFYKILK